METSPVLSLDGAGKAYRIWEKPAARLISPSLEKLAGFLPENSAVSNWLIRRARRHYRDFWALSDISFNVRRGESIALIGRNGSGKSTLLQLIAGTLKPSCGSVRVNGRVAALLELGAGFDAEFSGRENVYVNASILGLTREQIDARLGDIQAFAEIGDFFDQPVKTYSSGMVVRLAFAVAVHVQPDILIVDEALSVGDARFQLKCARAIDRFIAQGVTLLFVSHDLSLVKRLCQRALLLDHGRLLYSGKPNDVANLYSKLIADGGSAETIAPDIAALRNGKTSALNATKQAPDADVSAEPIEPAPPSVPTISSQRAAALLGEAASAGQSTPVTGNEFSYGGEWGKITSFAAFGADGRAREAFDSGETITLRMRVEAREHYPEPIYAFTLKNAQGVEIYGTNTLFAQQPAAPIGAGESCEVDFVFKLSLPAGAYFVSFGFTHFVGDNLAVVHRRYDALRIDIHHTRRTVGLVDLRATIHTRAEN